MCLHFEKVIILVYIDNIIIISKDALAIDQFVKSLEDGPENFDFTHEGTFEAYLGVEISQLPDNKGFHLSQPFLIECIIQALGFDLSTTKGTWDNTPAGYPLLSKDENGPEPTVRSEINSNRIFQNSISEAETCCSHFYC